MQAPSQKHKKTETAKENTKNYTPDEIFINLLPSGKVYFSGKREVNPGLQVIDLEKIPYNAKALYVSGFQYLALKPEAAEVFKSLSEETLQKLIKLKKETYPADVPILEKALELKQ